MVIKTTPLEPRFPYKTAPADPFNTVILSMSFGLMSAALFGVAIPVTVLLLPSLLLLIGTPSTTYKGSLSLVKDFAPPLIISLLAEPGAPFDATT